MTTECQCFIDAGEIKGVRIECGQCHVRISVSFATEKSRELAAHLLSRFVCPHCSAEWFSSKDAPYLELVSKLLGALAAIGEREPGRMKLLFEVAPRP